MVVKDWKWGRNPKVLIIGALVFPIWVVLQRQFLSRRRRERGSSLIESPERRAVEDLIMHYRVERAARRMGKFALLVLVLVVVAAVVSVFRPKYL